MPRSTPVLVIILTFVCIAPPLCAQTDITQPDSRAGQIEEEREAKAQTPAATQKPGANILSRLTTFTHWVPLRVSVEGLGPGHGLTLSTLIEKQTRDGQAVLKLFGSGDNDGFYTAGVGGEFPHLTRHDITFGLQASYSDSPQLEYYGSGPNSSLNNRTSFLREDTLFSLDVRSQQFRRITPSCSLGELLLNAGPGTNQDLPTTQAVFSPAQAPGVDHQSNYLIAGCSVQTEWRDFPEDPHRGTFAVANYRRYSAQDISRFSFHRVSGEVQEYIPFFNEMRVIALFARTEWALHEQDQVVPFYLQSTLGSDTDLRGYRRYRFYDENSAAFTAEYRVEVSTGIDLAIFGDAGQVFHSPDDILTTPWKYSEGFGFRFKGPLKNVVFRVDTGFSKEGVRVWLKFAKQF